MEIIKFDMTPAINNFVKEHYNNPTKILNTIKKDSDKRLIFDGIFGWILEAYHYEEFADKNAKPGLDSKIIFRIDSRSFKDSSPGLADKYLQNSWMHSPKATTYLCKAILDAESYPLSRELRNAFETRGGFFFLGALAQFIRQEKWSALVWLIVFDLFIAYFLGLELSAIFLAISLIRIFYYKYKFLRLWGKLIYVINQISTYAYNSSHISELLREAEKEGLYVSSIVFSLLKLQEAK